MHQKNTGSGDNVGRDKIVRIDQQIVQYAGERTVPRLLTSLPALSDEIIGREEELSSLYDTLEAAQKVVLINGMGGVGKTTVATAYANRYQAKYTHIVWLEQLGDFATDLTSNVVLTTNLGVTLGKDPQENTALTLNALANLGGKSLLVIDNGNAQLQRYHADFPKAPNWHVLITSRQELPFARAVPLDFLTPAAALRLFYSHYHLDKQDELALEILRTVDYHTLTIEILAKTAQNLDITSVRALAELLEQRGIRIGKPVDFTAVAHSRDDQIQYLFPYLEAIFQLPEVTEDEAFLLKQFIGLPPIFHTWEEVTHWLSLTRADEATRDRYLLARNSLRKKGWLIYDEQKRAYKMHRIIQEVLRKKLAPTYADLKVLVDNVTTALKIDQAKDNPVDKFPYVGFGTQLLDIIPDNTQKGVSSLQNNLAMVYQDLGDYSRARDLLELVLQSAVNNFGEDHPSTAISRSNLALVYQDLGEYVRARDLLEVALQSDVRNFGDDHPTTARSRSNLAVVCRYLGEYIRARDLLKVALESDVNNFGEEHPNTARRHSNLALVYKDLGDYDRARDLLELALQSDVKNFGDDHPITAIRRSNLATVHHSLGNHDRARELFQQALATFQTQLGGEHPHTKIVQQHLDSLG